MSATIEALNYFQGSEVYGHRSGTSFHYALKDSLTNTEDPMPTVLIEGGKTLSGKTRHLLIEADLFAQENIVVRPPIQWAESIHVANEMFAQQTKFGELKGPDYEAPTLVFENSLLALIRAAQGKNELITGDSPLFTGVPFGSSLGPNVNLEFFYGHPVVNSDQEFRIDINKLLTGSNRVWTTARRLFLHQPPFNRYRYRSFLVAASASVDLRIQGLAKRVALHNAQSEQERARALEGIGYHVDDVAELMKNPARAGGPLKAVIAVDRDMDQAARDIINLHLVMPPHGYRSEGEGRMEQVLRQLKGYTAEPRKAIKTTELMVDLNGQQLRFLDAMARNAYYRLEVDRELTLPISAEKFFGVPPERCLLSLLSEYDPGTELDGNLLSYPGEYLKDIWRSSWSIDKQA